MGDFDAQLRAALERGAGDAPGTAGLAAGARRRLKARRRRTAVLGAAAAIVAVVVPTAVIASGGDGQRPQPVGPTPDPEWYQEIEVTCVEGWSWPVSAMADRYGGEVEEGEVRAAFANLLQEAPVDAPEAIREHGFQDVPYVVLAGDDEEAVVGVGEWSIDGPGEDGDYVLLERQDADLRVESWGQCELSVALPDDRWRVELSAPRGGVDPASTGITVLVNEVACTSARDPRPYLDEPVITEQRDRVLVSMSSEIVRGGADCPGNPRVPVAIQLDRPLGDRELYDAGTWPPTPIEVADPVASGEVRTGKFDGITFDVPAAWTRVDCASQIQYSPTGACIGAMGVGLRFLNDTFQPAMAEGELVSTRAGERTVWGGYVFAGDWAVYAAAPERDVIRTILDSVREDAPSNPENSTDLPCDPGMGDPRPSNTCPDPKPDTGRLLMDGAGEVWFDPDRPGSGDERIRVDLRAVSTCSGVITVGHREPLADHVVDCEEFREALEERPDLRIAVAIWSGSGVPIIQLSELYHP